MRFYASFSLAFGLVAASPCKPLTSGSTAVSATFSSSATEISTTFAESGTSTVETLATETSTVIESETSTAIDTTATEASTFVGSTSTEITDATISASETSSQATSGTALFTSVTSADATTTVTTETSTAETSAATTTTVETSTAMTTTTTSEEPGPTDHLLIAGQGSAQGLPLKTTKQNGDYMIFGERSSSWTVGRFVVDPTTGYLTRDGIPVCAKYHYMDRHASLTLCSTEYNLYGTARLTCARNPAAGTALQCSAVKLDCVSSGPGDNQRCSVSTEANWTKFFISVSSDYTVYLGADDLAVSYLASVDIFVDRAPTAAAPTAP
ncbi:hypothetical protein HZS61_001778 [Fusarium oxysporum f. sp. conglutinans]|uniref:Uncharacterized protein n=2 Tax=Fusarium oxysporum f. sp. conglutinans TaxID=100902 RepID=A0A8H6H6Z0_FUSOX|nr:hypothetical protein FOXB_00762 [Fusarium oxysporum f. sp. conglutinans Fo5176]KAF6530466.1 hypothetical protein HZS61_001778 [Fusarium oxysporum f. sp. conglutinans]KAG6991884.1 hypothetical protein FocnCong_v017693 [Fusarium oxysporum f. sp. conglutinans]KAI8417602.1 hypothetical protein FOFC_00157 [Fusarium oxysporum]